MVAPTSSSSALSRRGNPRAVASAVVGALSVAAVPLGTVVARYFEEVSLVGSGVGSIPAGVLLGFYAIVLARRGRETVLRTLGRSGGGGMARVGRALGVLGICVAITAALTLLFYGLLLTFE
jgi:hypothetical protein